ncbi:hypothetical protein O181_002748 [Austropuccinia psidii MF-1]|uniref:Ubiquitin 3 binding protein But2 C-terminal domain-containing protein n=1 Tax=Austropuccinia psidii MF-1 TaxID=1389203 RepID=A0A9Q3BDB4_9BASI|nr:hypothetical protein [Austropuccinia psidii MF-1]
MRLSLVALLGLPYIILAVCNDELVEKNVLTAQNSTSNLVDPNAISGSGSHDNANLCTMSTAGPSGILISPKAGMVFKNHVGNVGNVEVIYQGVSDGSNSFGARTCTIDVHLAPKQKVQAKTPSGSSREPLINLNSSLVVSLARGMRPHDSGSSQPIWANFVPPPGVCGEYHLVVYERQLFKDTVIHFQSAAPVIKFECARAFPKIYKPNAHFT